MKGPAPAGEPRAEMASPERAVVRLLADPVSRASGQGPGRHPPL